MEENRVDGTNKLMNKEKKDSVTLDNSMDYYFIMEDV